MARSLSISYDPVLLATRQQLLENMGHSVISAEGFARAYRECEAQNGDLELVILGHSIPHDDNEAIIGHVQNIALVLCWPCYARMNLWCVAQRCRLTRRSPVPLLMRLKNFSPLNSNRSEGIAARAEDSDPDSPTRISQVGSTLAP